jgi:hypothetical protein
MNVTSSKLQRKFMSEKSELQKRIEEEHRQLGDVDFWHPKKSEKVIIEATEAFDQGALEYLLKESKENESGYLLTCFAFVQFDSYARLGESKEGKYFFRKLVDLSLDFFPHKDVWLLKRAFQIVLSHSYEEEASYVAQKAISLDIDRNAIEMALKEECDSYMSFRSHGVGERNAAGLLNRAVNVSIISQAVEKVGIKIKLDHKTTDLLKAFNHARKRMERFEKANEKFPAIDPDAPKSKEGWSRADAERFHQSPAGGI